MKGKRYEDIACSYLKKKGFKIVYRNYRTKFGEIDIVAYKKGSLIFVEVKGGKGYPRYRVDPNKMKRIELTANKFVSEFKKKVKEVRFDVIEVTENKIVHIEGVGI